jgi:hypothetical protein
MRRVTACLVLPRSWEELARTTSDERELRGRQCAAGPRWSVCNMIGGDWRAATWRDVNLVGSGVGTVGARSALGGCDGAGAMAPSRREGRGAAGSCCVWSRGAFTALTRRPAASRAFQAGRPGACVLRTAKRRAHGHTASVSRPEDHCRGAAVYARASVARKRTGCMRSCAAEQQEYASTAPAAAVPRRAGAAAVAAPAAGVPNCPALLGANKGAEPRVLTNTTRPPAWRQQMRSRA